MAQKNATIRRRSMTEPIALKNTAPQERGAVEVNLETKRLLEANFTEDDVRLSFSFVEE